MYYQLTRCLLCVLFVIGCCLQSMGQSKTITGVVRGANNQPLGGVSVNIKGTDKTVVTNEQGEFSILVAPESVLRFSFVGYAFQEFMVGNRTSVNVKLAVDNKQMEDVVVVGYGTQKRGHLTSAIETIKGTEIEDLPLGNLGAALSGRILGLSVSGGTSRPGSQAQLTIRNPLSLAKDGGNNSPLFVIDDVIQVTSQGAPDATLFNSLDPSEVESITILKDASAAVYGSRGANGVILVRTKRGSSGKPRISYSGSYAINDEVKRIFQKDYKKITLNTHPFIAAFLTKGFPSVRTKWFLEHKKWVKIQPRDAYTYLEYHFHDKNGELIK